ncbi:MAG: hypothetical protein A2Y10_10230 [Planctomycetes bacterium GWF2_41_51]|nr:MAG: hypothetical protein A2Y10_10230 [Planctomycetes bacterium GWF2_41_51]
MAVKTNYTSQKLCRKTICHSFFLLVILGAVHTNAWGFNEWMWNSKFPLQFNDGTQLPAPFADDVELQKRIDLLNQKYAPFTENLLSPSEFERPEQLLSSLSWKFKDDTEAKGENQRWFAIDTSEDDWTSVKLPDHREFALGWYRTTFDAPSWSADRVILHFDAVDYGARVYLNDKYIGEHTGYYLPFEFDVTDFLKPTGNVLAVRVDNPQCWDGEQHSFQGDGEAIVAYSDLRGVVQFSNAAGIYQPVKLIGRSSIYVTNIKVTPQWPDTAKIEVNLTNILENQKKLQLKILVAPRNFESQEMSKNLPLQISKGNQEIVPCKVPDVRYWTPDCPYLYTVRVTLEDEKGKVLDCIDKTFGMRWISQSDDGTFLLNNRPYYMRGSGAFGDFWLPTLHQDADAVVRDILLYKAANLDMARTHIHTLPEWFYQYADMYGLMLYTDMPLNAQEGFVGKRTDMLPMYAEEIKRQFKDTVESFYNHPSIIFWEFINESQWAGDMPPVIKEFVRYSRQIDPTRLVCGNSGFTASYSLIAKSNKEWWGFSDHHWYYGWYVKTPFYADFVTEAPQKTIQYTPDDKKMLSEYGSTGYPDWQTWQDSFTPWEVPASEDDIWDVRRIPMMRPVYRGITYMSEPLQLSQAVRYYGGCVRPSDWIKRSQAYQAYQVKSSTDVLRRRPDINGYCHFHLIDPGPITWPKAVVDNKRRPKEAYFALAQACAPQRVNIQYQGRRFYSGTNIQDSYLWVYNDRPDPIRGVLRVFIADESGNILAEKKWTKDIEPATRIMIDKIDLKLPVVSTRQKIFMYATLSNETGLVNYDCLPFEVFPKEDMPLIKKPIALYDVVGNTAGVLKHLGLEYSNWKPGQPLTDVSLLIIGAYSSDTALVQSKETINEFLKKGGNVLVLNQATPGQRGSTAFDLNNDYLAKIAAQISTITEPKQNTPECNISWLPFKISFIRSDTIQSAYVQNLGRNALTEDLSRDDLFEWHGGYNFAFENPIEQRDDDETLITCGNWQNSSAVLLKKVGQGNVLLSQLLLVNRYGVDPVASHILQKMLDPVNWKKLPGPTISKSAVLTKDGKELTVKLTASNPTNKVLHASIVDPVMQDCPAKNSVQPFKQDISLKPGESQKFEFKRSLDEVFSGDLPPAVLVFEDGLWTSSELVTVGILSDEIKLIRTFDFGSNGSPLADGATCITNETVYSESLGFGWDGKGGCSNIVIWKETPLLCDFNAFMGNKTFKIHMPTGEYTFRISANSVRGQTWQDPYDTDCFPPVNILCDQQPVGRIIRMIPSKTATLVFTISHKNEGPIAIEFRPSFVHQMFGVSAIEIYQNLIMNDE